MVQQVSEKKLTNDMLGSSAFVNAEKLVIERDATVDEREWNGSRVATKELFIFYSIIFVDGQENDALEDWNQWFLEYFNVTQDKGREGRKAREIGISNKKRFFDEGNPVVLYWRRKPSVETEEERPFRHRLSARLLLSCDAEKKDRYIVNLDNALYYIKDEEEILACAYTKMNAEYIAMALNIIR